MASANSVFMLMFLYPRSLKVFPARLKQICGIYALFLGFVLRFHAIITNFYTKFIGMYTVEIREVSSKNGVETIGGKTRF